MLQMFVKRLGELGYAVSQGELETLVFCKNKVENYIKNYCNLAAVPDGLLEIFVERVCGEFLLTKRRSGNLNSENFEDSGVKSITEGDVSVTFSDENYTDKLIEKLLNSGGGELLCYRKIRW